MHRFARRSNGYIYCFTNVLDVENRTTPLGGRHQRHLVVYTQNSSGIKCTPQSGRFGQIGYHYKVQDRAKKCPPVLKCISLRGAKSSPDLPPGALPPGPPLWALPQTPVIGSRSRARLSSPPFCSPNFKLLPTPLMDSSHCPCFVVD